MLDPLSSSCPTTPCSQDKGRTLDLLSWTWASPFVDYEASHISEPLFPGGTSVFRVHTILMPPKLPRFCTALWSPLRRQNTKANSVQSMTDFTLLNYPPILGGWANDKKMSKIYIWIKRTNSSSPRFLPLFGGILPILPILGGYWPILLSIMGKKWGGISHSCCLPESYFPIIAHGSICSFLTADLIAFSGSLKTEAYSN